MDSSASVVTRPEHDQDRDHARSTRIAMGCCAVACILVGTSFGSAHLLAKYPYPTGQALRYALAAIVLAVVAR